MFLAIAAVPKGEVTDIITQVSDKIMPVLIGLATVVILLMLKQSIFNLFEGIAFRRDPRFREDDEIMLGKERAIIGSIALFKTKIYMLNPDGTIKSARYFPNYLMKTLRIEKIINIKDLTKIIKNKIVETDK